MYVAGLQGTTQNGIMTTERSAGTIWQKMQTPRSMRNQLHDAMRNARDFLASRMSGRGNSQPTNCSSGSSLALFSNALTSVQARSMLREGLERRRGNECFEFLIVASSFKEATNPLQRYQLFSHIVHRFLREGADRQIQVSPNRRDRMLAEWQLWAERNRSPAGLQFDSLDAIVIEVSTQLATSTDS
jgi:hypothetical protein